jgi:TPR repeat protein
MTEALRVRKRMVVGGLLAAVQIWGFSAAFAGPWEDGMVAYNRGDYLPAMRLFRPLADRGNPKAQNLLGVMYRKGQGVTRNSVRAFVWFSRAAARGDARAKVELHEVSQTMTAQEMSEAEAMARACEASNYRSCEY